MGAPALSLVFHEIGNVAVEVLVREHGLPASGPEFDQFFATIGQSHGPWIPNSPVDAVSPPAFMANFSPDDADGMLPTGIIGQDVILRRHRRQSFSESCSV